SQGVVEVVTEAQPWPERGRRRRAAVSSFGISGTNAHLILEEAAPSAVSADTAPPEEDAPVPWVLSARSEPALRAQAQRLAEHVAARPDLSPRDVAYALATTRTVHDHRAYVVGSGRDELLAAVAALGRSESSAGIVTERTDRGRTAFVFTGQGSQRPGMGRELARAFPVFDTALREVFAAIDPLLDLPLASVMWADPDADQAGLLDHTAYAQPALFAYEVALYRLFESAGVVPDQLVGHSIGEIAAAHVAGVLSLTDACSLVAARGRMMQDLPPGGAMVAVRMAEKDLTPWLDGLAGTVAVAAVNGPSSVVLSGADAEVTELADRLAAEGYKTRRLVVSHAFHSPLMDPMLAGFRDAVGALTFAAPAIPLVSGVTGRPLTEEEARDPGYWVRHVREPVRFKDAIDRLRGERVGVFVELGPEAALTPMLDECLFASGAADPSVAVVPTRPGGETGEERGALAALALLHLHGADVAWAPVLPAARSVPLPTYPFQRRMYWLAPGSGSVTALTGAQDEPSPVPDLTARLAGLDEPEQDNLLLGLVLTETEAVLGGRTLNGSDATSLFSEIGLNSVNAIELRNRLIAATGLRLQATVMFDYPTPTAVARLMREDLTTPVARPHRSADRLLDELEDLLATATAVDPHTAGRLETIAKRWRPATADGALDVSMASDEELFRLMDASNG
ncbi:MAG: acyltransferase domain-containing protein, partial [Actinoallomurus sp.]